jgi:hypothetical protein
VSTNAALYMSGAAQLIDDIDGAMSRVSLRETIGV